MGFDCITVHPVPEDEQGNFQKLSGPYGYFRYSSGVTSVLGLLGVPLDSKGDRLQDGEGEIELVQEVPLSSVMSSNGGLQVTPKECLQFARVLSNQEKMRAAVQAAKYLEWLDFYCECGLESPEYWEEETWNNEFGFFQKYAEFCEAASEYGGFYVW